MKWNFVQCMNTSLNKLALVWNDCNNNNDWHTNTLWTVYLSNLLHEVFKLLVDSTLSFFVHLKFVVHDSLSLRSHGHWSSTMLILSGKMRFPSIGSQCRSPLIQNLRNPGIPCHGSWGAPFIVSTAFSAINWHQLSGKRLYISGTVTAHAPSSFFMQTFPPWSSAICFYEFPSKARRFGHPGQRSTLGMHGLLVRIRIIVTRAIFCI